MRVTFFVMISFLALSAQGFAQDSGDKNNNRSYTDKGYDALGSDISTCKQKVQEARNQVAAANSLCKMLSNNDPADDDPKTKSKVPHTSGFKEGLPGCQKQFRDCSSSYKPTEVESDEGGDTSDTQSSACQKLTKTEAYNSLKDGQDKLKDRVNKANDGISETEKQIADAQKEEADSEKSLQDAINKATNDAQTALLNAQKANGDIDKQLSSQITAAQDAMNKTKQDAQSKIVAAMTAERKYADTIRQLQLQCESKVKDAIKQHGEVAFVNMNSLSQSASGGGVVQNTCKTDRAAVYGARDAEEQKQQDLKQITNELSADQDQMANIIQRMKDDTAAAATDKQTALRTATVAVQSAQKEVQSSNQALQSQQKIFQQKMQALQTQLAAKQVAAKQAYEEDQNDSTQLAALKNDPRVTPGQSIDAVTKNFDADKKIVDDGVIADGVLKGYGITDTGDASKDYLQCIKQAQDTADTLKKLIPGAR